MWSPDSIPSRRDDPTREIRVMKKALAETLPRARAKTGQRILDFRASSSTSGREFLTHSQMTSEQVIQKCAIFSQVIHREKQSRRGEAEIIA